MLTLIAFALADDPREHVQPTSKGELHVFAAGHGTMRLRAGKTTIWLDPWSKAELTDDPADLVLITDIHGDHLDPAALAKVSTDETVLVAPKAVAEKLDDGQVDRVLANGERTEVAGIGIEAVAMYNNTRGPEPGTLFHAQGRGNGYLLTVGESRVYIAGDTACTPEMKGLKDIDLAFVPMNLPYTMPPDEAAACVKAFAPDLVIPYHYRGSDLKVFRDGLAGTAVKVKTLEFYPGGDGK